MMFFLVLFCFGAVFGDANVTAPAGGQNVTGPAPSKSSCNTDVDISAISRNLHFRFECD